MAVIELQWIAPANATAACEDAPAVTVTLAVLLNVSLDRLTADCRPVAAAPPPSLPALFFDELFVLHIAADSVEAAQAFVEQVLFMAYTGILTSALGVSSIAVLSDVVEPVQQGCTPSTRGMQCMQVLQDGIAELHWSASAASAEQASFLFSAKTDGYVSVGFGASMYPADCVIGWVSADGSTGHIAPYHISGYSLEDVVLDERQVIEGQWVSQAVDAAGQFWTTITFTRNFSNGGSVPINITEPVPVIWAIGGAGEDYLVSHCVAANECFGQATVFLAGGATASPPAPPFSTPPSSTGHECMAELQAGIAVLYWKVSADMLSVDFHFVGATTGYVSVGFGANMYPADCVIGWVGSDPSTAHVAAYRTSGYALSDVAEDPTQTITNTAVMDDGTYTHVVFTRALNNGGAAVLDLGALNIIWAIGGAGEDELVMHCLTPNRCFGQATVSLLNSCSPSPSPPPPSPPPPPPSPPPGECATLKTARAHAAMRPDRWQ